mmetsp:Transcript_95307/g.238879  ORF Transcript_95307/g.238879 Transcript_95307/m.238879 type:complete len:382 (+) Transcript_95307:415-1560(+)
MGWDTSTPKGKVDGVACVSGAPNSSAASVPDMPAGQLCTRGGLVAVIGAPSAMTSDTPSAGGGGNGGTCCCGCCCRGSICSGEGASEGTEVVGPPAVADLLGRRPALSSGHAAMPAAASAEGCHVEAEPPVTGLPKSRSSSFKRGDSDMSSPSPSSRSPQGFLGVCGSWRAWARSCALHGGDFRGALGPAPSSADFGNGRLPAASLEASFCWASTSDVECKGPNTGSPNSLTDLPMITASDVTAATLRRTMVSLKIRSEAHSLTSDRASPMIPFTSMIQSPVDTRHSGCSVFHCSTKLSPFTETIGRNSRPWTTSTSNPKLRPPCLSNVILYTPATLLLSPRSPAMTSATCTSSHCLHRPCAAESAPSSTTVPPSAAQQEP